MPSRSGAVFWALHILCIDAYVKRSRFSFWQFVRCVRTAPCSWSQRLCTWGRPCSRSLLEVVSVGIIHTHVSLCNVMVVGQKDVIPAHAA